MYRKGQMINNVNACLHFRILSYKGSDIFGASLCLTHQNCVSFCVYVIKFFFFKLLFVPAYESIINRLTKRNHST